MNLPPFVTANPFMSGGLLVAIGGSLMAYLKALPAKIGSFFTRMFSVSLTVTDDTRGFYWMKMWIAASPKFAKKRRLDLHTPHINGDHAIKFSLAPGTHFFWYHGHPAEVTMSRSEEGKGSTGYSVTKRTESFTVRVLGRNRGVLADLVSEAKKTAQADESKDPTLNFWDGDGWVETRKKLRDLNSVILPDGTKEGILADMKLFLDSEDWYRNLGIPYHRGYLFYGKPGGGKTALVTGLANELKSSIYFMKLNDMSDSTLAESLRQVVGKSIVVMEDADCVVPHRQSEDGKADGGAKPLRGCTLSGLLNVLDGLQAPHGVFYIMTTNNRSALDSALLRPGRMDLQIDFDICGKPEAAQLARRFFPDLSVEASHDLVESTAASSMAEYQESFIQKSHPTDRRNK